MLSLFGSIATGFSVPNESQISLFPFLHLPLRHGLRVFNLIPQIAVRKYGIAHDVDLTETMVPFITLETALRQNVVELVFGINVFDSSSATPWVRFTCLIVGLLPLITILITASLSSKIQSKAPKRESFAFDVTSSTFLQPTSVDLLDCSLRSYVGMIFRWCIAIKVAPRSGLM